MSNEHERVKEERELVYEIRWIAELGEELAALAAMGEPLAIVEDTANRTKALGPDWALLAQLRFRGQSRWIRIGEATLSLRRCFSSSKHEYSGRDLMQAFAATF
jgi:hypothetical protein